MTENAAATSKEWVDPDDAPPLDAVLIMDCIANVVVFLIPDQPEHTVFADEASGLAGLMLPDPACQIGCHSGVKCPVLARCKDVNMSAHPKIMHASKSCATKGRLSVRICHPPSSPRPSAAQSRGPLEEHEGTWPRFG